MIETKNSLSSFVMSFDFSQGFGIYIQVHLFDLNNAGEKTLIYKQPYCIITHLMTAQRRKLLSSYYVYPTFQTFSQFDHHSHQKRGVILSLS